MARVSDGQGKVDEAINCGNKCCDANLPKASTDFVHQQVQDIKQDWHHFLADLQVCSISNILLEELHVFGSPSFMTLHSNKGRFFALHNVYNTEFAINFCLIF